MKRIEVNQKEETSAAMRVSEALVLNEIHGFRYWVKRIEVNQKEETSAAMRVSEALVLNEIHGFRYYPFLSLQYF